ncbi:MAG: RNA-directed DNA polymerase [Oleiphilaceae bacterium]|jgi:RNA-directed DNA polymerase
MQIKEGKGAIVRATARPVSYSDDPRMWSWVEASVWTDRMLAALGNGVRGGKWHSLIDKVYALQTLRAAWKRVASNRGAAGIDRVSIKFFETNAEYHLNSLGEELRSGNYKPLPIRRVHIPKGKGKTRPLGIATVKDRIVQCALKLVMEPIFEKDFLPVSFGFRPERSCKDALRRVDKSLKEGFTWVVDADLQSYFDTIPKQALIKLVETKISDVNISKLLKQFLDQDVIEGMNQWTPTAGTPQGSVISPLMSNLYLHGLDELMSNSGVRYVRFADDFVAMCRTRQEAEQALETIRAWVESHGLILHPDKTHVGNCVEWRQGFEFLGYRFEAGKRWVRSKSKQALRDRVRLLTGRLRSGSLESIIKELNAVLRGWFGYFKHAHRSTFRGVDGFVRCRLRAILRKREKRPGFGRTSSDHKLWPNAFFAKRGLFTMNEAHVTASQSR